MRYRKRDTVKKAAPPVVIAGAIVAVLRLFDIDVEPEAAVGAAGGLLALWGAWRNWKKNRRKK